ncbi:hypothetical protein [Motilibacter aurantiacus]|uniref:hypothetical protein n=1 Tax=Motilibacter aurantiacus TaxID=2714955 RepID=UPI001409AD74|nr:hypothetical protein [Motilibacter aurantiacus]NHC47460.1 hypothetical protein [Motilibacter aurantiacus]
MVGTERRAPGAETGSVLLIRAWLEDVPDGGRPAMWVSDAPVDDAPRDEASPVAQPRPRARLLGVDVEGEPADTFTTAEGVDEICRAVRAWLTGLSTGGRPPD